MYISTVLEQLGERSAAPLCPNLTRVSLAFFTQVPREVSPTVFRLDGQCQGNPVSLFPSRRR